MVQIGIQSRSFDTNAPYVAYISIRIGYKEYFAIRTVTASKPITQTISYGERNSTLNNSFSSG
ncbi:hypothetical protein LOAG_03875 [Loa loa]|uniref:Uncharacterized protein n=1 Tax=Loa loa TaxID=7209 RepID=A0A1I7VW53_LOALO|nr:hypothetical protein LOAG_03875 [Loa loa]EFO24608.1 hypothetical protein LOAG_03875 [Loa loa]